jgi:hypothetical protein
VRVAIDDDSGRPDIPDPFGGARHTFCAFTALPSKAFTALPHQAENASLKL